MKLILLLLISTSLLSCATGIVVPTQGKNTYTKGGCTVEVYNSLAYAKQFGEVSEVCRISGSTMGSFDHSFNGAIKKNISKVCGCGANKAYVVSASQENDMGFKGVTNITMVAFNY